MINQKGILKFFKVWVPCLLLVIPSFLLSAQKHTHKGYYFSIGGGYADGSIIVRNNEKWKLTGPAFGMHVFIGGSLKDNLYLHFSFEAKTMHPLINGKENDEYYTVEEVLRGAGVTYYTKRNFFISGNAGLGKFFITDKANGERYDTNNGFALRIMGGKEWWISSKFALGLAGGIRIYKTSI